MIRINSSNSLSTDSDEFFVEQFSGKQSPPKNTTSRILNSTDITGPRPKENITHLSVASPEPQIIRIESDSKKPTFLFGYEKLEPITPLKFNDLTLMINLSNIMATVEIVRTTEDQWLNRDNPSPPCFQKILQCQYRR